MFYVYILECADGTYYTGQTKYLDQRMKQHASGRGAKYVRSRLPFRIRHTETYDTRGEAMRRESEIKRWSRDRKSNLFMSSAE